METKEDRFIAWLEQEINKRGWSQRETARRAGFSHAAIPNVLNRKRKPGQDFCVGIARAFKIPTEEVMRRAGILPELSEAQEVGFTGLYDVMRQLSPDERREVYEIAKLKVRLKREKENNEENDTESAG